MKLFGMRKRAALAPGTPVFVGERKADRVRYRAMAYDPDQITEETYDRVEDTFPHRDSRLVSWVDVTGLHDVDVLEAMGRHFGLHPLVVEDIVHTRQRPKLDDYAEYLYLVTRMIRYDRETGELHNEQVSIVVGGGYVLTFQEHEGDVFDPIRERIRRGKGRARRMGTAYLAYMLIDAIVDHYFVCLENMGERIETLEEDLLEEPSQEQLQVIHALKREIILLRKAVWAQREVVGRLDRGDAPAFGAELSPFLRDLYDHTVQVLETVESFRDVLSGLQDLYLSSVSNRMNEVMKTLTLIATIFIPLSFLAGVFGMNFEWMPELQWKWGYPLFWVVAIFVGLGLLVYFRKRDWL